MSSSPSAFFAPLSGRRSKRFVGATFVLLTVVLALGIIAEVSRSGNESSRLATVEALVEQGTLTIERSRFETVDRVKIDGRFFSNKPLLFSLWLSALHWPAHAIFGLRLGGHYQLPLFLLTLAGVVSFSVLLGWMFWRRLCDRGLGSLAGLLAALGVVLTTWIWSYGTTINNHTPAAALVFALVWLVERQLRSPDSRRALVAGLVAGALLAIEIPTGGIFFLVGLLALASDRRPERRVTLLRYGLGFGIVTLSMALVNLFAYGYPLDAYLVPGSFAFDESIHAAGAAGLRRPDNLPAYLFHLTLGQRGVFSHMPFLLLALGYLVTRRGTLPRLDRLAAAGILVLWVFYGTQTGIYGGWAYGFRFLVPVIPLLFWWSTLWVLESPRAWRTGVAVVLLVVGLVTSWVGTGNPWPVAYEGVATRPGAIEDEVRSPLLSNLLVWSFERNPRGALFERLSTHYGRPVTLGYLEAELWNRRRPDARERLLRLAERWRDVE